MLERTYNIPLRKEFMKVPRYKRAGKAMRAIKQFLSRHMKCEDIKLGSSINLKVHEHGRKNICHHINVIVQKDKIKLKGKDVEQVRAELVGVKINWPSKEEKKKKSKKEPKPDTKEEKLLEKIEEAKKEKASKSAEEEKKIIHDNLEKKQVDTSLKEKLVGKKESVKEQKKELVQKEQKPVHEKKK